MKRAFMHNFFITDGTKYHDGDVEEVFGVVTTTLPKSTIERYVRDTKTLRAKMHVAEAVKLKFELLRNRGVPLVYTQFDWEYEQNVIGV